MLKRLFLILAVPVAIVLTGAAPALAHGGSAEADVRFAQTIAGMELTVVIRANDRVPAPLNVDVVAHGPDRDARVTLGVRSTEGGGTSSDAVRIVAGQGGMYPAELWVDRVGPHELELRAGGERSVLPFRVLVPDLELWEVVAYGAFACAAVSLIAAMVCAPLSRRGATAVFAVGFVIAAVVAFTTAALSPWIRPTPPEGAAPAPGLASDLAPGFVSGLVSGRPNAQPVIEAVPERPARGTEFRLRLKLFDGSTGLPVDDLVEHHAALTHVVVTSDDGTHFRHVHPARTAPGTYEVRLRAQKPGRHLVYAEFERADAGGRLVSGEFTVGDATGEDGDSPAPRPATNRQSPDRPSPNRSTPDQAPSVSASTTVAPPSEPSPNRSTPDQAPPDPSVPNRPAPDRPSLDPPASNPSLPPPSAPDPPSSDRPVVVPMTDPPHPVAGRPVRVRLDTGADDVQPWLGMAGHLIVRSRTGDFLGHVHERSSMPAIPGNPPDESVAIYGPGLEFTFSFPAPGRYLLWIQYARDFEIVTVPHVVDVAAEGSPR
ncbi:hypothetical protein [Streptosporangium sp. NBC_01469]|uniref:hypothetical protein n=1 Tax=Streptosporangium sp. NBC_01469 TaxID=2903898 RepID=UPI002E29DDCA|nr:hypothetical protein [Streptosporangium sp. NBC_01469]